jgi:hypothetical protein
LVERPEQYAYCSANGQFEVDAFPRGLKPNNSRSASIGAAEAAPFQNIARGPEPHVARPVPFQRP